MKAYNLKLFGILGIIILFLQLIYDTFIFNSMLNQYFNPFVMSGGASVSFVLFNGILFGILLMAISIIYIFHLNLRKSIKFGIASLITSYISILLLILIIWLIHSKNPFLEFPTFSSDFGLIIFSPNLFLIMIIILTLLGKRKNVKQESIIRKKVLNLATKFDFLKLNDIVKKIRIDKDSIIKVVNKMIQMKEVYAEYFNISRKFAFNKRANTEEIDRLMELYQKWEKEAVEKIM